MAFRVRQTAQADYDLDIILEWLLARQAGEAGRELTGVFQFRGQKLDGIRQARRREHLLVQPGEDVAQTLALQFCRQVSDPALDQIR